MKPVLRRDEPERKEQDASASVPPHNAFKTAEECAKWLDSISHIEGSYATSNAADWLRLLASAAALRKAAKR